jgi:hypothetical protein
VVHATKTRTGTLPVRTMVKARVGGPPGHVVQAGPAPLPDEDSKVAIDLELPHVAVPSDGRKATACYVFTRWRYTAGPAWSRPGVLARDGHRCGYCGGPASTVDYILPRSRGGRNTWTNTIAACDGCNQRKDGRTPPRRA